MDGSNYYNYMSFLNDFSKKFSERIDDTIKTKKLEDSKYFEIFETYSQNNKKLFEFIMSTLFDIDIDFSQVQSLIDSGELTSHKLDKDLNDKIHVILDRKIDNLSSNSNYFDDSDFVCVLLTLKDEFAYSCYFTFKDGKIKVRDLKLTPEECVDIEYKFYKSSNYDAIMDKKGNIYFAMNYHGELMAYLLANSIDLREGVRIADSDYLDEETFEETFDLSSLGGEEYDYASEEDKKKDRYVYLSKSRIRKICEFMKGTKPHLTKTEMINTFKKAIGFGYDFLSTSIENETNINYNLAVENLTNIMEVLDEMFPNETSINLVEMCQNRFKELSLGLYNL